MKTHPFIISLAAGVFLMSHSPFLIAEHSKKTPEPSVPWAIGEKLHFSIKVGILAAGHGALGVKEIVEVPLSTGSGKTTAQAYHFVATAESNKFVDIFYKVRDKNESWLDLHQPITHRFEQHNQEGKYILDQIIRFDWVAKRFKSVKNVQGREPKIEEGDLTIPVIDTLSSLYMTRMKDLKVGQEFTLDVHSGKTWPISVKVIRKETVKVPAGKFECFLVEPYLRERGLFIQKGKKLEVWLTADKRKIPVKMRAEIFIGHVSAKLTKIE